MTKKTIRKYNPSDCQDIIQLFYNTIHAVNAKDYRKEQLDAWASKTPDLKIWNESLSANYTYVAVENNVIVGFGDIDKTGYLDRLFVHKDHQREGIATAICDKLERTATGKTITTHASITAKPFFEKRGYKVVKEQLVQRQGVFLTNYIMTFSPVPRLAVSGM